MEHGNLSQSFEEEGGEEGEKWMDKPNQGTLQAYVEMSQQNTCTTIISL
jgi:hypothetical protein